uniref:Peptidase S1 domain-containing protein n=1 Tax=Tetradesmus obliquus TaxID=3088 RepID=A0A383W0C9_TETOB|eukprot:jgi/Sobl393_1/11931/SZX70106.1
MKCLQLLTALLWVLWLTEAAAAAAADAGGALESSSSSSSRRKLRQLQWYCQGGGAGEVIAAAGVTKRSRAAGGSSIRAAALPITYDMRKVRRFRRKVPLERQKALYEARVAAGEGSVSTSSSWRASAAAAAAAFTPGAVAGSGRLSSSSRRRESVVLPAALVRPASVCPLDPPFNQTTFSRTTCRLFVQNKFDGLEYMCTAWFITPRHVVTAGHCVSTGSPGWYHIDESNPGSMCCHFSEQRSTGRSTCTRSRTWRLLRWVTTKGYLEGEVEGNDGAVIEVEPADANNTLAPLVQRLQPFYPGRVGGHTVYMDGYPGPTNFDVGCENLNITRRYATQSVVRPLWDDGGEFGLPVEYAVAGCVGQSGGRVLRGGSNGGAYGIQTYGNTTCEGGRGLTGVTQISTEEAECGVCVSCLLAAIQQAAGVNTSSPSPSPSPSPVQNPSPSPSPLPSPHSIVELPIESPEPPPSPL